MPGFCSSSRRDRPDVLINRTTFAIDPRDRSNIRAAQPSASTWSHAVAASSSRSLGGSPE